MNPDDQAIFDAAREHVLFHLAALASKLTGDPLDDLLSADPRDLASRARDWIKGNMFGDDFRRQMYRAVSDDRLDAYREEALKALSFIQAERERRA